MHEHSLNDSGFVVLPGLLSANEREQLATEYDAAVSRGREPDLRVSRDGASVRLSNLIRHDSAFDELLTLRPILDACELVIGERFKLSGLRGRTVLPGATAQALHVDVAAGSADWPLVGFIVMLDDFRLENGATRFVPGSHKLAQDWRDVPTNHRPDHPEKVAACGEAGSVVVFHGSTWHGFGANVTSMARRSIQGSYIPANGTCAEEWSSLAPEIVARLPACARRILDIE